MWISDLTLLPPWSRACFRDRLAQASRASCLLNRLHGPLLMGGGALSSNFLLTGFASPPLSPRLDPRAQRLPSCCKGSRPLCRRCPPQVHHHQALRAAVGWLDSPLAADCMHPRASPGRPCKPPASGPQSVCSTSRFVPLPQMPPRPLGCGRASPGGRSPHLHFIRLVAHHEHMPKAGPEAVDVWACGGWSRPLAS